MTNETPSWLTADEELMELATDFSIGTSGSSDSSVSFDTGGISITILPVVGWTDCDGKYTPFQYSQEEAQKLLEKQLANINLPERYRPLFKSYVEWACRLGMGVTYEGETEDAKMDN